MAQATTSRGSVARRGVLLALALLGAGGVLGVADLPSAQADQGWWGDLDKGQSVRLGDILASPERFRGRTLTFTCVFHRPEREFNPLRTRFNAERYDNVSVWPDAAEVWAAKGYEQDFPFLYVARSHPQRDELLRLETFTRLEVTARIEAVLSNTPFLELTAWRATGHRLGKEVVEAMTRGETYARSADPDARAIAIDNFRRALDLLPDLAPVYAERIRQRLAKALVEAGRADEAQGLSAAPLDAAPSGGAPGIPLGPTLPGQEVPAGPAGSPDGALPPTGALGAGGTLPGIPVDEGPPPRTPLPAPAPLPVAPAGSAEPWGPTLPGTPYDAPPAPAAAPLPAPARPPAPASAPAPARAPSSVPAPAAPRPAPSEVRTWPGTSVPPPPGTLPPAPAAGTPAPALPAASLPGTPVEPPAPVVVDPPLPPPAPGGAPPPRRPRLAGVK